MGACVAGSRRLVERRPQVGNAAALGDQAAPQPSGEVELRGGGERRVEHEARDRLLRRRLGVAQVGGEDRGQDREADHHAGMPRGDRPAAVKRARDPVAERGRGKRVDREPKAEADEYLRRERPDEFALGRSASPVSPPAISTDPATASERVPPRSPRNSGTGRQRRNRYRRDRDRSHRGRAAPAVHEQKHQQEQRRRERRRQQRQRQIRQHVRAIRRRVQRRLDGARTRPRSAIAVGSASSTTGICTTKIARQEKADVRSPPTTGPSAAPATPAAAHRRAPARSDPDGLNQQLEASDDHQRAARRLDRARRDQHAQRRGQRAHGRRGREHDQSTDGGDGRIPAHTYTGRRHRRQSEHEVESDQHPRDLPHAGPEVAQDLR